MAKKKLTALQKRFVSEYLLCLNATEAAKTAGYSKKTARFQGYNNMQKPHIAQEINQRLEIVLKQGESTLKKKLIDEAAKIALSDIKHVTMEENSSLIEQIIYGTQTYKNEKGEIVSKRYIRKIKLHSKVGALGLLFKYLKLYQDTGDINIYNPDKVLITEQLTGTLEDVRKKYKYNEK